MIEINLLSEELRLKARKAGGDYIYIIYAAGILAVGVIILLHLCLFLVATMKACQVGRLSDKLHKIEPQRKAVQDFKSGYDMAEQNALAVRQLITRRITWSEKLNRLSLDLPYGIWFTQINLNSKGDFTLSGSVVSLDKPLIGLINKLIDNLKKDKDFFNDFSRLELVSTQGRIVGSYDIDDFVLAGQIKAK